MTISNTSQPLNLNYQALLDIQSGFNILAATSYDFYVEYAHRGIYQHARHTHLICDKLQQVEEGKIKYIMFLMPPRHSKSMTITETFPSYFIGRNPDRRVIAVSYGDTLARKFGRLNRHKVDDYGPRLFGIRTSRGSASITNWSVDRYIKEDKWEVCRGGMISSGIGGAVTGEGAHLLLIDDPVKNRKEADSEVYQEMVWSEYQNTLLTRLQPGGAVILVVTRWNERDLAGRALAAEPGKWEVVSLSAIAEGPGKDDPPDPLGRKPGEALWPEIGFDEKWAADKKTSVGTRVWQSLYQQKPTEAEGTMVKSAWWRFYKVLPEVEVKIQLWDTGYKVGRDNDPSCCLTAAACRNGYYFIEGDNEKLEYPALVLRMKMNWAKHDTDIEPLNRIVVEDEASGQSAIQSLKLETSLPVFGHDAKGKVEQVRSISAIIEAGRVYLPVNEDGTLPMWVAVFLEQWNKFPNGRHDEYVDVGCMALIHLRALARNVIHTSDEVGEPESEFHRIVDEKTGQVAYIDKTVESKKDPQRYAEVVRRVIHDDLSVMARDTLLRVCKEEGHVPYNCRLYGDIVMEEVRARRDPCQICEYDRDLCRGRKKETEKGV